MFAMVSNIGLHSETPDKNSGEKHGEKLIAELSFIASQDSLNENVLHFSEGIEYLAGFQFRLSGNCSSNYR